MNISSCSTSVVDLEQDKYFLCDKWHEQGFGIFNIIITDGNNFL